MKSLILIVTFFCIITVFHHGQATPTVVARLQKKMSESSMLDQTQQQNQTKLVGTCSYNAYIRTSCYSPINTTDQIGIKFGDGNGGEVYLPRLDEISGGTFEPCTVTSFDITGPCTIEICKVSLLREGARGWLPFTVMVSDYKHIPTFFWFRDSTLTIYDSSFGYDHC